ncbi:PadR family transcriptional regulator [Microbulbifer sp. 2201CG32-9]|uniref:PadR family transcriptional regulator n=1 Tax=Microbulbifer sp. 2201CG32-9 TaxID=3232309 RepID=UPI00345B79DE
MEPIEHKWNVQFRKGTLEMVILALLGHEAQFGLQLLHSLHQFETMKITEGTLYPLLDRLKREGVIESYWLQEGESRPRKYYRLSAAGRDKLDGLQSRWLRSVKDINKLFKQCELKDKRK